MRYIFFAIAIIIIYIPRVFCQPVDSPWPMLMHDARHTGQSEFNGPSIPKLSYKREIEGKTSFALGKDGTIYYCCYDRFHALNPVSKKDRWWYTAIMLYTTPAVGIDGTVYFGSYGGYFYALNPNGSLKWDFGGGHFACYSSPVIGSDGTIFTGSNKGYLYAIYPDGALKWRCRISSRTGYSSPVVGDDGTVYFASTYVYGGITEYLLEAINPKGYGKWEFTIRGDVEKSSPSVGIDGNIYIASGGYLQAVTPDGELAWEYRTSGDVSCSIPAVSLDGTIYIGARYEYFYAIDPDGELKWKVKVGDCYVFCHAPTIGSDGTIYTGLFDFNFYALNPEDGKTRWKYKLDEHVGSSSAIVSDGVIYVMSRSIVKKESYAYFFEEAPTPTPTLTRTPTLTPTMTQTPDDIEVHIDIKQNETFYRKGDRVTVTLDLDTPYIVTEADLYFVMLEQSENALYFAYNWERYPKATLSNVMMSPISVSDYILLDFLLPCNLPPVKGYGLYTFGIAAVEPGTLDLLPGENSISMVDLLYNPDEGDCWFEGFNLDYDDWEPYTDDESYMVVKLDHNNKSERGSSIYVKSLRTFADSQGTHVNYTFDTLRERYHITPETDFSFDWYFSNRKSDYVAIGITYYKKNAHYSSVMYCAYFCGEGMYPPYIKFLKEEQGEWHSHRVNLWDDLKEVSRKTPSEEVYIQKIDLTAAFPDGQEFNYDNLRISNLKYKK